MAKNFLKSTSKHFKGCMITASHERLKIWVFGQVVSLVLAENFLKSSLKCLLACVSSGTHGKIQNWGFFGQKVSKNGHFCKKIQFLKVLSYNFNFLSLVLAQNFVKSIFLFYEGNKTIDTHQKVQNRGLWSTYRSACANLVVSLYCITSILVISYC